MNRLRDLFSGSPNDADDDYQIERKVGNSWNSRYGYNSRKSNEGRGRDGGSSSRYNDDLYLSDDDEWGMSTVRESDRYNNNYNNNKHEYGERRSSSAFWDQTYESQMNERSGNDHSTDLEMSAPRGAGSGSNTRGLQEWEREAIMRDNLDSEFEIGNDDYYHSDTQRKSGDNDDDNDDVHEDLEEIDNSTTSRQSLSSDKEEVVNAYRDYLKSIRDGGFESYLDGDNPTAANEFNDSPGDSAGGGRGENEDEALERVLDIEEERRGSLYGDLYGVQDMRSTSSSPYTAWRAKAKALLQQEEERAEQNTKSPSRKILEKFRRKRSSGAGGTAAMNGSMGMSVDRSDDGRRLKLSEKLYSYRPAMFLNPRCRGMCIAICLILSLAAGLSYYGDKSSSSKSDEEEDYSNLAIPPKPQDGPKKQQNTPPNGQLNPALEPSDAIKNAMKTFDPIWYNRRSGWNGITYKDAVGFCSSLDNHRVPCPYEMYCTQGSDGSPFMGDRPNGEQWAPISNGANQFVQVGGMFTCKRYTDLHDQKKPTWGITGVSTEHEHGAGGITQNVMCCVDVYNIGHLDPLSWGNEMGKLDPEIISQVEGDQTMDMTDKAIVNTEDSYTEKNPIGAGNTAISNTKNNLDSQKREKAVIAAFQPIWFSTAHGWSGTSYEDGINFCESYNHMVLCECILVLHYLPCLGLLDVFLMCHTF